MGVRPLEPGFAKIEIEPRPGSLAFAALALPTIRGTVRVRFENDPGRAFRLDVEIPTNTTARVTLPTFGVETAAVRLDGTRVLAKITGTSATIELLGSGSHSLELDI